LCTISISPGFSRIAYNFQFSSSPGFTRIAYYFLVILASPGLLTISTSPGFSRIA
jgi:hypothetical protein